MSDLWGDTWQDLSFEQRLVFIIIATYYVFWGGGGGGGGVLNDNI